jgi:predicted phage tail protein
VGLDGTIAAPGQIIRIADAARAGKRQGGRVHGATTTVVTVDKAPTVAAGDTLTVNMGDGTSQSRTVASVAGNAITVTPAFTAAPATDAVWTVESTELAAQTFRVLAVTEDKSDSDISFTLTCLQHNASKFAAIDTGTIIQVPPISALTPKVQAAPSLVTITEHPVIVQGIASITLTIGWTAAKYAVSYDVEWRKDDGQWISAGNVEGLSADVVGIRTGEYQARVRARNSDGDASAWTYANGGEPVAIVGKVGSLEAPTLTAVGQLFGIKLLWQFSSTQNQTDNAYTEIKYNTANDFPSALDFGQFAYPLNIAVIDGLLANVPIWGWARVVDKSGNTSNWVGATAITTSTADLFKPITDAADELRERVD